MTLFIVKPTDRLTYPAVAIQPQQKRLSINQHAWNQLVKNHGGNSMYIQTLLDDSGQNHNCFWLRLCAATAPGARKLDAASPNTRTANIASLIRAMNLEMKETSKFPVQYDQAVRAFRVDVTKIISDYEELTNEN